MKRRVTIRLEDALYKRVRHRLIDQDMTLSGLVSRYLSRYLGTNTKAVESEDTSVQQGELVHVASEAETEFWEKEAQVFDNAMPKHGRPKKTVIGPVEQSVKAYTASLDQ